MKGCSPPGEQPFLIPMENNPKNNNNNRFTFQKKEKLCSKKQFDKLFADGSSFLVYPLKVVFIETELSGRYPAQAAFTVSKKLFKSAVKRNLLKRRMREAYRLNKPDFYFSLGNKKVAVIFIFVAKEILGYNQVETAMKRALKRIAKNLSA
ncbi:MAG: ribonuclease P protein component [Tangfeifania sp.]